MYIVSDMSFRVVKRDRQHEEFNAGKLMKVVEAAGLTNEEAKKVCVNVTRWIEESGKPLVTSIQIRDRVIIEMQRINHEASKKFVEYEKSRDRSLGSPVQ